MKNLFFYLRGLIGFVIGFLVVIGLLVWSELFEQLGWPLSNEILNSFVV